MEDNGVTLNLLRNYRNAMLYSDWRMDAKQTAWYYCGSDGKMAISQIISWKGKKYYVGNDGAMVVNNANIVDPDTGIKYLADMDGVCMELSNITDSYYLNIATYVSHITKLNPKFNKAVSNFEKVYQANKIGMKP